MSETKLKFLGIHRSVRQVSSKPEPMPFNGKFRVILDSDGA